ncbi:MAG: hypothetical protein AABW59_04270 [archaeon]|mgnify:CR=1 FL=1
MVKICFATGNLYKFIGKIDIIEIISNLDIDGIEWTYGKEFGERVVSCQDEQILQNFSCNSLHAPFHFSLKYHTQKELEEGLTLMEKDAKKINAKQIVFHPGQIIPKEIFSNCSLLLLTENLSSKKSKPRPQMEFEEDLANNPSWGLCLDVSHAYSWGQQETKRIVDKWGKRIKQVHLSNCFRNECHMSFEHVSKGFCKSIEPLDCFGVPIIIEEEMKSCSPRWLNAEVKRIKNMLG